MINTQANFIKHLDTNRHILASENRKNLNEVKGKFYSSIGQGVEAETAFNDAIKAFQEKVNPSQDMLVTSEKIAQTAKEAIKPDSQNLISWVDTIQAAIPMIEVYNEWVNHLNENKDKPNVFYA